MIKNIQAVIIVLFSNYCFVFAGNPVKNLTIGNEYHFSYENINLYTTPQYEVVLDTVSIGRQTYFLINRHKFIDALHLERADSANLYSYDNGEYVLFNYNFSSGDVINYDGTEYTVQYDSIVSVFGRETKKIAAWTNYIYHDAIHEKEIIYLKYFGLNFHMHRTYAVDLPEGGYKRTLIGCKINGQIYGDTSQIQVTLDSENIAPEIISEPDTIINAGSEFNYQVQLAQTDDETHLFLLIDSPEWLTINQNTGEINGLYPEQVNDRLRVTVYVFDPQGNRGKQCFNIKNAMTPIDERETPGLPEKYQVGIFPNPFNLSVTIRFSINNSGSVSIKIFNAAGKLVKNLASSKYAAGQSFVKWDGLNEEGVQVSSGLYFCQLQAENQKVLIQKMVLLK